MPLRSNVGDASTLRVPKSSGSSRRSSRIWLSTEGHTTSSLFDGATVLYRNNHEDVDLRCSGSFSNGADSRPARINGCDAMATNMNSQCRTRLRVLLHTVAVGGTLLFIPGCEPFRMVWNSDLEYHAVGDEFDRVELVSISSKTRVIASAKRVDIRTTSNPDVTELDVDETHYVRGTLEVVYTVGPFPVQDKGVAAYGFR